MNSINEVNKPLEKLTKVMKLATLNNDCLELLFDHLELDDMISVADTSRIFYVPVCLAFKSKYKRTKIIINPNVVGSPSHEAYNKLFVHNSVTALKFLRNFGHLLWNMQLNCKVLSPKLNVEFTHYLFKYCSKSLQSFSMYHNSSEFLFPDNNNNVFTNLFKLKMEKCTFGRELNLNKMFPNVSILHLGPNRYEYPEAIRVNLPSVKELIIQPNTFEEEDIKEVLKMNPQLERLTICPIYYIELIRWINEWLPKLRYLQMKCLPIEFYAEDLVPIQLDHIVNFSLHVGIESLPWDIPFLFEKLEKFLLFGGLWMSQKCLDFFARMKHLKQLTILGWYGDEHNIDTFFKLENILSNVEELHFSWIDQISSNCILQFLEGTKSLTKMTINVNETKPTIDIVSKKLNDGWQMREGLFNRQYIIERISG